MSIALAAGCPKYMNKDNVIKQHIKRLMNLDAGKEYVAFFIICSL